MKLIFYKFLYLVSYLVLFILPENKNTKITDDDDGEKPSRKPIRFVNMDAYLKSITKLQDHDGACIAFCQQLKEMSIMHKGPVKFTYTAICNYAAIEERSSAATKCYLSGFTNDRWYKLRELSILNASHLLDVLDEMVEAMAQEGWMCMNDGTAQLFSYIENCLSENSNYLKQRAAMKQVNCRLRVQTSLVVNVFHDSKQKSLPSPHLAVKISVWPDEKLRPVETEHIVYFTQQKEIVEKNKA